MEELEGSKEGHEILMLQHELQQQISEQRASLQMVQDANEAAPSDELTEMCADLVASIRTMEDGLAQLLEAAGVKYSPPTNDEQLTKGHLSQNIDFSNIGDLNRVEEGQQSERRVTEVIDLEVSDTTRACEGRGNSPELDDRKRQSQSGIPTTSGRSRDSESKDNSYQEDSLRRQSHLLEIDSRCRFKGRDGRWHNGLVLELGRLESGSGSQYEVEREFAVVGYLTPTTSQTRLCSFFAQRRCRFGDDCRSFHGMRVSVRNLRPYQALDPRGLTPGERVLALREESGLWETAEIETLQGKGENLRLQVAFVRDGMRTTVNSNGVEALTVDAPEDVSECSGSGSDGSEDADLTREEAKSSLAGLGSRMTSAGDNPSRAQAPGGEGLSGDVTSYGVDYRADAALMTSAGIQKEARLLAGWEAHTRGVASKMMASMGFVAGGGLGRENQGMVAPLPVEVLPKNVALDCLGERRKSEEGTGRKKSRGGEKSRKRKAAQAARDARAEEGSDDDMFSFINRQLATPSAAHDGKRKAETIGRKQAKKGASEGTDRQRLLAQGEDVEELRKRIAKLQEMADRNRKDRTVSAAVQRKLDETRKVLSGAEAAHASALHGIREKESHKKLLKW